VSKPNNVIDLLERRRRKNPRAAGLLERNEGFAPDSGASSEIHAEVVDMTGRRNEMLTQERRLVKRTILSEFVGAFAVVPEKGLQRVAIYDISETGVAFDLPAEDGAFNMGEEVAMRVYMNQHTYFPFIAQVHNVRRVIDEGVVRHGAGFVRGTINDVALHHFVRFIESVSASLETDHGDVMVSSLRR
jgi:hypothetical protein